jgi:hypothetical protein
LQNRVFAKNVAVLALELPPQNNKANVLFQPFEKLGRNKKFISFLSWFKAAAVKHTCKQEVRNKAKGFTQKLKI